MIQSKNINIIVAVALIFAIILSVSIFGLGNSNILENTNKSEPLYAMELFGTDIISIEILADEADWQEMLDNAISEQFIMVDVIVNGTKFQNVGIRPKGNSSLTQVASSDSDRYSFRLQFDEYIKDQTCFGLQSFVVNNMLGDNTYMKEYVSYELMKETGVDCPYFGYANIKLNGEAWGLYLAVELYNESYEQRIYGSTSGMLYNVKTMEMGGVGSGMPEATNDKMPNIAGMNEQIPLEPDQVQTKSIDESENVQQNDNNFLDFSKNGNRDEEKQGGGNLKYSDDNSSSYSAIFDNVVGKGKETDYQRVISSLKALSDGTDLEKYFDVDKILRYLAVHTIVVNLDSYSSSMAQNYYIYENNGKVTILPWDYNLAWGGFQSGNAVSVINFPIDTPVSGVEMSERPLLEKLFSNEEYLQKYHIYLQQIISEYFTNGKFESRIKALDAKINEYVKNDKNAFCTYDKYQVAISAFITLGNLRAKSVQGQLDGTIPSTIADQTEKSDTLISAGELNLNDLGSMMGGNRDKSENGNEPMQNRELMQQAMQVIQGANGEINDEVKAQLIELGLTDDQISMILNRSSSNFPNNINRDPSDIANKTDSGGSANITLNKNNIGIIGVLTLFLITAIIITVKHKKNY